MDLLENRVSYTTSFSSASGSTLRVGHVNHTVGANEYFPGLMDELAIWNDALAANEAAALV